MEQAQELVRNENILLQTLGFDVAIDHPHTHVVKCCQLVKASKELAQTSYFMATNRCVWVSSWHFDFGDFLSGVYISVGVGAGRNSGTSL